MQNKTHLYVAMALPLFILMIFGVAYFASQSQANATDGSWSWSGDSGWIGFNDASGANRVRTGTNVATLDPNTGNYVITTPLLGYGWNSNGDPSPAINGGLGWLRMDPDGTPPEAGEPAGVRLVGSGDVRNMVGWARFCSVFQTGCSGALKSDAERGGWDGWLKMVNVVYNSATDATTGYAWGDLNVGWVDMSQFHLGTGGPTPTPTNTGGPTPTPTVTPTPTPTPTPYGGFTLTRSTAERIQVIRPQSYPTIATAPIAVTFKVSSGYEQADLEVLDWGGLWSSTMSPTGCPQPVVLIGGSAGNQLDTTEKSVTLRFNNKCALASGISAFHRPAQDWIITVRAKKGTNYSNTSTIRLRYDDPSTTPR